MRLAAMLAITGTTKVEFDGAKRGDFLPFYANQNDTAAKWADYDLLQAIKLKAYTDLTRSGLTRADACHIVSNCNHACLSEDGSTFFGGSAENPAFVAREVYYADYAKDFDDPRSEQGVSAHFWGGTHQQIFEKIFDLNTADAAENRKTISVDLYNMTNAEAEVRNAAHEFGLPEAIECPNIRLPKKTTSQLMKKG